MGTIEIKQRKAEVLSKSKRNALRNARVRESRATVRRLKHDRIMSNAIWNLGLAKGGLRW